jgi:hypothetical protein
MTLQARITEARFLLEANKARKPLVDCATGWRSFVRLGDRFLEAVEKVIDASERAANAEDRLTARRANSDISGAMSVVTQVTGQAYGFFATGRENLYEVAKLYGLSTKRPGSGYGKKPTPLEMMADAEIIKALAKGSKDLSSGILAMLNKGAGVSQSLRMAAQQPDEPPSEVVDALVKDGLDFRDAVSVNVFARTNGIMRRAAELSRRNWELMMMEDSKLGWVAPWEHDPEIGNIELI